MTDEPQMVSVGGKKFSTKTIVLGVVGLLILVGVAGAVQRFFAKNAMEQGIEKMTGGQVNVDSESGEVTVKTDQGSWSTSDKLPDGFPTDAPVYPGAKVQGSVVANESEANGHYAGFLSTDSVANISAWYLREVPAKGWKIISNASFDGSLMLAASKDTREMVITVAEDGDSTAIGIVVTQK